jgi:hypothetical protein
MVVFGAGASFDSSPDYKPSDDGNRIALGIRPPLANQLFELRSISAEAVQSIPRCLAIIHELRYLTPDTSVEQQLERMREAALNYLEGQRQLVSIRFYLQWIIRRYQSLWNDAIKSQTTYRALLGQIDRQLKGEPACFVTFNYDTLLEEAFTSLGIEFESLDDYVSRDTYKVIKLHGSTNWAHELSSPMKITIGDHVQFANHMIQTADKFETDNNYYLIPRDYANKSITSFVRIPGRHDPPAVLPAIAIPVEKKHSYECPPGHVDSLKECISKADKLLLVGWRAAEENFVNLLAKGLRKNIQKMVVSRTPDSAEKIRSRLIESGIDGAQWNVNEGGFTDQVLSGRIERFVG